jgi:hypothetical protein
MDLQRIIAKFGRSESIASQQPEKSHSNRNLLELIAHGPNTFGTHEEGVEIPKTLMKNFVEDAKKTPKTPLPVSRSSHRMQ